jgi:PPOX class probable F420-dependent enzyme
MDLSNEIAAFVHRQPVARLATADSNGQPHVVPVCFVYENGSFYIAIDEKPKQTTRLKRLRNIEVNPHVALVIDVYHDDWSQLAWVMVQGTASIHDTAKGYPLILAALRQKYPQYRTMTLESRPLIQVVPEYVTSWGQFA